MAQTGYNSILNPECNRGLGYTMAKAADIGGKRLIGLSPDAWAQWATQIPNITVQEIVSADFQWVSRESDVLLRARSPQLGEFLVLNELQLRYTQRLPRRIRAYAGLAEEKYDLPVYPILINILPASPKLEIAKRYESEFVGLKARQDYRIINLWEVDANLVFQQSLPPLLPFVPILKGGNQELLVRQALRQLRADQKLSELEPLLAFFASFVLETPLVQQIMRWDMTVLRESPWYQEIWQEAEQSGEQRGLRKGLLSGIELALKLRFGEAGLQLLPEIRNLEAVEQLEAIQAALASDSTLEELRQIYS